MTPFQSQSRFNGLLLKTVETVSGFQSEIHRPEGRR
jgi:hypothetical protein